MASSVWTNEPMGWFVLWIAGIVVTLVGIAGTANVLAAKSGAEAFNGGPYAAIALPTGVALSLLLLGTLGTFAAIAGTWRSCRLKAVPQTGDLTSKASSTGDWAAIVGLVRGSATLLLGIIPGLGVALWPVPVGAALIGWLALALRTRSYRRAVQGLAFGSVAVVLSGGLWLLLLFNGNGSFS